ncbi:MAG TPA: hypothetical protein VIQ31_33265, partial [Phormidium sp.]
MSGTNMSMIVKFDGKDKQEWPRFVKKTYATGAREGGWHIALKNNLSIEDYETDETRERNQRLRQQAWSHLLFALENKPLDMLDEFTDENPYDAWEALNQKYLPKTIEAYAAVSDEFEKCVLPYDTADPENWIEKLIQINTRLGLIG